MGLPSLTPPTEHDETLVFQRFNNHVKYCCAKNMVITERWYAIPTGKDAVCGRILVMS